MNITSAKYIADLDGVDNIIEAVIDGITMCIPLVIENTHYQAILEWVADGNTITRIIF